ncbi:MAG: hypothetical protein ACQSGP_27260 [Frankia sp.]
MNGDDWFSVPYQDEPAGPNAITGPLTPTDRPAPGPDRWAKLRARMETYESGRRSAVIAGVVLALLAAAVIDAVAIEATAGPSRSASTRATADLIGAMTTDPTTVTETAGPGSPGTPSTGAGPATTAPAHATAGRRPTSVPRPKAVATVQRIAPAPAAPRLAAAVSSGSTSTQYTFTLRNSGTAPLRITAITLTRGRDVPSLKRVSDRAARCMAATAAKRTDGSFVVMVVSVEGHP